VTKQKTTSKQDSCLLKDLREPGPSPTAWIKCFRYWLYRNLRPDAIAITRSFRPTKRIFAYLEHSEYQFTFNKQNLELYAGVKNLLNWTPNRKSFYHSKSQRPFDKNVQYDSANAQMTQTTLCFNDPGYVYGPNQGRSFLGCDILNNFYYK
jgi:hypothetical protein